MHDISTQVIGVRQEPSKDGQSIKHIVSITGGTAPDGTQYPAGDYITFNPELSGKASGFQGQQASVRVEIKQTPKQRGGGFWTNYNIEDIGPVGTLAPQAMPAQGGVQAQPVQAPVTAPNVQTATPHVHPALAGDEQRRSEENRRSAMHAASEYVVGLLQAGLIQHPDEASRTLQQTTQDLVRYITTGSFEQSPQQAAAPPAQPQTAEQVAAGIEGVTVGVPFDAQPPAAA